ncbi:hypothetical protein ACQUWX_22145, partial [Ralstonia pseudosolanacearum]
MTRHAATRTGLDAKRLLRRRRGDAVHAMAIALALLAGTVWAQPAPAASPLPAAAALPDLSPLARML